VGISVKVSTHRIAAHRVPTPSLCLLSASFFG
jgi:hypothetical protein